MNLKFIFDIKSYGIFVSKNITIMMKTVFQGFKVNNLNFSQLHADGHFHFHIINFET